VPTERAAPDPDDDSEAAEDPVVPPSGGGEGDSDGDAEAGAAAGDAPDAAPETGPEPGEEKRPRGKAAEERPVPPPAERLTGAVEALLLASGESLSADRIRDVLGLPSAVHVREAIAAIRARWAETGLAVELQDVAGGHRVVTRPEFAEYVRRLSRRAAADRLSQTLLETLSIVAYKQPVARAEVERIRGVQAGDALRGLLDRRLIKVAGRSDQPGRPLLYATTTRFLEVFGLAGLADLPNAKDLNRL
jgi:segregation and condensation protein B